MLTAGTAHEARLESARAWVRRCANEIRRWLSLPPARLVYPLIGTTWGWVLINSATRHDTAIMSRHLLAGG